AAANGLTGDLLSAALLVDVLALALFFLATHRIFTLLEVDRRAYALYLGLIATPVLLFESMTSTDLLSLALCQLATWMALASLRRRRAILFHAALGAVCFAMGFLRYSYYTILFAIPAAFVDLGRRLRDRGLLKAGVTSGVTAATGLAALSLYQRARAGHV